MTLAILIDLNAALLFGAVVCFMLLRRPPAPLGPSLLMTQVMALLWIAGDIGTQLATDLFYEQLAINVIYAGSLGLIATWWVLAFRFAERHGVQPEWATRPLIWGPSVFALVAFGAVATNPIHGQFLTPVIGARNEYHWMWWATAGIGYTLIGVIAAGYFHLYRRFEHVPIARRQSGMMLGAALPVLLSNAMYTLAPIDWPFDLSIMGGLVAGLVFVCGSYYGSLYDLSVAAMRDLWNRDATGLLVVDADGRLLYANPRAHDLFDLGGAPLGGPVGPIIRANLRPTARNGEPFSFDRVWNQALSSGEAVACYHPRKGKDPNHDGGDFFLWLTAHPIAEGGEPNQGLMIRVHDMTRIHQLEEDRRAIEARLTQSDRLRSLGVLSAGIAHEVNNPVGSVLIAAQFGRSTLESATNREEALSIASDTLDTVIEQSQRAARVTRAVLRFAREDGTEHRVGDLREVMLSAKQFTHELSRRHGATVDLELCDDPMPVRFNATEMEQVLVNLIHNAIASGKPGRHVEVHLERDGDHARIRVADDGNGMTAEQLEHAFEPFYTSREGSTGTGLGLSVVHGIVSDCGGETWLESELGLGTRAIVRLPLSEA